MQVNNKQTKSNPMICSFYYKLQIAFYSIFEMKCLTLTENMSWTSNETDRPTSFLFRSKIKSKAKQNKIKTLYPFDSSRIEWNLFICADRKWKTFWEKSDLSDILCCILINQPAFLIWSFSKHAWCSNSNSKRNSN